MDEKARLLLEFYQGLPKDRLKLETCEHGFDFLESLLEDGAALRYGEAALAGGVYKYKLTGVSDRKLDELIADHVAKKSNVCLYFGEEANSVFCFNLDNNHKLNNTAVIPEMSLAVETLRSILTGLGCEPFVIASGRGYHLWCRLSEPVENQKLYDVMLRAMAKTLFAIHQQGLDYNKIKANFYPDPRTDNTVSLRLFGSDHAKNKTFSRVLTPVGLLDEAASWEAFQFYLRNKTIDAATFQRAYEQIVV